MKKISRILKISFFTNLFLSITKIVIGIIGTSQALIADGIHSFSDLITDIVAIVGIAYAEKPADEKHPYGHGKIEYVTSLGIGFVIIGLGFGILKNVFESYSMVPSLIVIFITLFTIVIKYILSWYLIKKGEIYKNSILVSSGKESRADVMSSIIVLISSIFMQFQNSVSIFKYADKIATVFIVYFVLKTGYSIMKENVSIILGEQEINEMILSPMKQILEKEKHIDSLDSFIAIKYGPYYKINSEVSMDGNLSLEESHSIIDILEKTLKEQYTCIKYIHIHVNPK